MTTTMLKGLAALYKPYKGGAGPKPEQVFLNNWVLHKIVHNSEMRYHQCADSDSEEWVVAFGDKLVCYDRWGFCDIPVLDGPCPLQLNQASLAEAYKFLTGHKDFIYHEIEDEN